MLITDSKGQLVSLEGHGLELPAFVFAKPKTCQEGTRILRSILQDPNLIVVYDPRCGDSFYRESGVMRDNGVYQVWGPSFCSRGLVCITSLEDDAGVPMVPPFDWTALAMQFKKWRDEKPMTAVELMMETERRLKKRDADERAQRQAMLAYAHRGVFDKGTDIKDITAGIGMARDGRSKRTAAEKGAVSFGVNSKAKPRIETTDSWKNKVG